MKYNLRVMLAVLTLPLIVCVAVVLFSKRIRNQMKGPQQSERVHTQREQLTRAFREVYERLAANESNAISSTVRVIQPGSVRMALSDGVDSLGMLPQWVTSAQLYVRTGSVSMASGEILCFVEIGNGSFPFGLDATGGCRYLKASEVKRQEFKPLLSVRASPQ